MLLYHGGLCTFYPACILKCISDALLLGTWVCSVDSNYPFSKASRDKEGKDGGQDRVRHSLRLFSPE